MDTAHTEMLSPHMLFVLHRIIWGAHLVIISNHIASKNGPKIQPTFDKICRNYSESSFCSVWGCCVEWGFILKSWCSLAQKNTHMQYLMNNILIIWTVNSNHSRQGTNNPSVLISGNAKHTEALVNGDCQKQDGGNFCQRQTAVYCCWKITNLMWMNNKCKMSWEPTGLTEVVFQFALRFKQSWKAVFIS